MQDFLTFPYICAFQSLTYKYTCMELIKADYCIDFASLAVHFAHLYLNPPMRYLIRKLFYLISQCWISETAFSIMYLPNLFFSQHC